MCARLGLAPRPVRIKINPYDGNCIAVAQSRDAASPSGLTPGKEVHHVLDDVARHIADDLAGTLPEQVSVARVRIWESARASATYLPAGPRGLVK